MTPERIDTEYCRSCALTALTRWTGSPHKNAVPLLPKVVKGRCQRCGGSEIIESCTIAWIKQPDRWALAEVGQENEWGRPYFSEMPCPKCQQRSIVSEWRRQEGAIEYKANCALCGVVAIG